MAFVNFKAIHHFQPPHSASRPLTARSKGLSTAGKRVASTVSNEQYNSMAPAPKITTSADLENCDMIDCVDLTFLLPTEIVDDP